MKGPKAPEPADPAVQANAEAAANRYNVNGPGGTQTWTTGGRQLIGYDSKGNPQYGVQQTQNITLGDSEQRQYDTRNQIAEQLLDASSDQIPKFINDPYTIDRSGFDATPYTVDTSKFGKGDFNYDQATPEAAKALYDRQSALLQPDFERDDRAFEQRMANSGIPVGSEAYNDALRQHENDQNFALADAARAATTQGSQLALSQRQQNQQEAGTLSDLTAQQRQVRNAEASQRAQMGMSERQQRYNEIAAALGSDQLQPVNAFGTGGAPIDVSGAYASNNAARMAKYQTDVATTNANNQALMQGLMTAAMYFSDERLKDDIEKVDELPTGEGVYEYHYKWEGDDAPKHTGVMAQEVERNYPHAVVDDPATGFKKVNYRRLIADALAEAA